MADRILRFNCGTCDTEFMVEGEQADVLPVDPGFAAGRG